MRAVLMTVIILAIGQSARADEDDVARGRDLASRWCSECHVIGSDEPGGDVGPSFAEIAGRPGQTARALRSWLAEPHPPMPDLNLTAVDTEVLAEYILSLTE